MKLRMPILFGFILLAFWLNGAYAQATRPRAQVRVRLNERLDTGDTPVGTRFTATVEQTVRLNKKITLARGSQVRGTVTEVVSSGRLKRPAAITLELTGFGGNIQMEPLHIDGNSHAARNTTLIGGGAVAGAILGAIAGGGKGALIGTAAGAGAGTAVAYSSGKHEIVLPAETELVFEIAGRNPNPQRIEPLAEHSAVPDDPAMPSQQAYPQDNDPADGGPQGGYAEAPVSYLSDARVSIGITIGPPPPPRVVYMEPAPGPGFVWVAGYWYPVRRHYVWHDGYWTLPPYEGARWIPPHHDGVRYFGGYWDGDRGRVEHDHHWDHDRGRDFDYERGHHDNGKHKGQYKHDHDD